MLIIGISGIGSWLVSELAKQIEQEQLQFDEVIDIADNDIVELKQLKYQNFKENEIGRNKAEALAERCKAFGVDVFKPIPKRIEKENQLKGYDFFILCVDNEQTRKLVIEYCHKHNKEFIDLRANGRRIFAMSKLTLEENLKFIDNNDTREYSCQDKDDLEKGWIQLGNKIVATLGIQMLLNYQRNISNRTISLIV